MSKEKPGLVKVIFDYQFHLGLPDFYIPLRFGQKQGDEKVAMVKVTSREGVQIFDKGKLFKNEPIEGKTNLILKDIKNEAKTSELVAFGEEHQPIFHHVVGKYGKSVYPWFFSEIEIIFPVNDVYSTWANPENSKYVSDFVTEAFNKLLLTYRHISNDIFNKFLKEEKEAWIFYKTLCISEYTAEDRERSTLEILTPQILEKRIFTAYPMRGKDSQPDDISVVQSIVSPPLMPNAKKKMIEPSDLRTFLAGSVGLYQIKVFNQVLLSGMERLAFDGDYRMAIIEFDTAVEMTVMWYLISFLIKEGESNKEIEDLLDENLKTARKLQSDGNGYLTTISRIKRLEGHINLARVKMDLAQVIIFDSEEQKNWNSSVHKKRNQAVHMWENFKKEDADEAFMISQKFIRFVQKVGDETLSKMTV